MFCNTSSKKFLSESLQDVQPKVYFSPKKHVAVQDVACNTNTIEMDSS